MEKKAKVKKLGKKYEKSKITKSMKGKQVCIVCKEEKKGAQVKDDFVIKSIRRAKEFFKIATGNKLVICENCKDIAKKKRQNFERTLLTYLGIGGVIFVIMVAVSIMSGNSIISILQSILVMIVFVLFIGALAFFNYFPTYEGCSVEKKEIKNK